MALWQGVEMSPSLFPDPVPRPRFYVVSRRGRVRLVLSLRLVEVQRLGRLLSRAMLSALFQRLVKGGSRL